MRLTLCEPHFVVAIVGTAHRAARYLCVGFATVGHPAAPAKKIPGTTAPTAYSNAKWSFAALQGAMFSSLPPRLYHPAYGAMRAVAPYENTHCTL